MVDRIFIMVHNELKDDVKEIKGDVKKILKTVDGIAHARLNDYLPFSCFAYLPCLNE